MPLQLIASGIAAGTGLLQTGLGVADKIRGGRERRDAQSFFEANQFEIPESAKASLASAERQAASTRLPAEDLRRAQLARTTAQGVSAAERAATSSSDVLNQLANVYGNQMVGEQNLALAGAERFDRNQSMLRSELGRMADLENQRWQYNVLYPYQQQMARAGQLSQRGAAGISAGLGAIGSAAGSYAQLSSAEQQYQDFLNQMGIG